MERTEEKGWEDPRQKWRHRRTGDRQSDELRGSSSNPNQK